MTQYQKRSRIMRNRRKVVVRSLVKRFIEELYDDSFDLYDDVIIAGNTGKEGK